MTRSTTGKFFVVLFVLLAGVFAAIMMASKASGSAVCKTCAIPHTCLKQHGVPSPCTSGQTTCITYVVEELDWGVRYEFTGFESLTTTQSPKHWYIYTNGICYNGRWDDNCNGRAELRKCFGGVLSYVFEQGTINVKTPNGSATYCGVSN